MGICLTLEAACLIVLTVPGNISKYQAIYQTFLHAGPKFFMQVTAIGVRLEVSCLELREASFLMQL